MNLRPNNTSAVRHSEFDGLRALACLAVFGVHLQQLTGLGGTWGPFDLRRFLENGNTGVALFFLLSGFHLSLPYWRDSDVRRSLGTESYALRRVVRIVPAYFACLAFLAWHQGLWHDPAGRTDVLRHALFAHNYWESSFYSISNPFWTIAVQAQFYVLLPVLLAVLRPVAQPRAIGIAVWAGLGITAYVVHAALMEHGATVDQLLARPGFFGDRPTVFSHSLLAHLPIFFWGVACGGLSRVMRSDASSLARTGVAEACCWIAGLTIPIILATPLDDALQLPHGRYNWPFIPALLGVVVLTAPATVLARRVLSASPLRAIGEISYGIYVYHLPCLRFAQRLCREFFGTGASDWLVLAVVGWMMTLLVAAVSYGAIERPLVRWAHCDRSDRQPAARDRS